MKMFINAKKLNTIHVTLVLAVIVVVAGTEVQKEIGDRERRATT